MRLTGSVPVVLVRAVRGNTADMEVRVEMILLDPTGTVEAERHLDGLPSELGQHE
jgi:hypothetical protein